MKAIKQKSGAEKEGAALLKAIAARPDVKRAFKELSASGKKEAREKLIEKILSAGAEWRRRRKSERTKAALAALKAQGAVLGRPRKRKTGAEKKPKAGPSKRELADKKLVPVLRRLRRQGKTFRGIAARLNKDGLQGRNGGRISAPLIFNVCRRNGIE